MAKSSGQPRVEYRLVRYTSVDQFNKAQQASVDGGWRVHQMSSMGFSGGAFGMDHAQIDVLWVKEG